MKFDYIEDVLRNDDESNTDKVISDNEVVEHINRFDGLDNKDDLDDSEDNDNDNDRDDNFDINDELRKSTQNLKLDKALS